MDQSSILRVAQIATGNIGSRALRRIIEHPGLVLTGVLVHSPRKVGVDAGILAGVDAVGIAATGSLEDIIATNPDCVLYMAQRADIDDIVRILTAGINIITTRHEFHNPRLMDPGLRERIEAACRTGAASMHSTGSSPGFSTEALPLLLSSLQRRVDHMEIHEFADVSSRASPEMILGSMGFGKVPAGPNLARLEHLRQSFGPSLAMTASAMGMEIDAIKVEGDLGTARSDVEIAAGMVRAGTVAAQRTRVTALSNGRVAMSFTATWYVSTDIEVPDGEQWSFRPSGWRVVVHGDTPLDVSIGYPVAPEDYANFTPNLTAHRPVNAIAAVCAARPGIVTTAELPLLLPQFAA